MKYLTAIVLVIIMGVVASAASTHRLNPKPKKYVYRGGPVVISELKKTKKGYKLYHRVYTVPPWISTPYKYNYRYNRSRSSFSR